MRLLLPISISLLLLALPTARAQTADDFFNSGAQSYISNNIPQALESVTNGLKQYPDDVKLKKLYELLKQQQNQQNQSKQQQSKQKKQNSNSQQNRAQQNQSQKNSEEPQNEQAKSGKQNDKETTAGQPQAMTPQEAKRLLDAQKGDEQVLQLKPKDSPQNSVQSSKDW